MATAGTQATVTDANVVLGRLSTRGLLGGDMSLDVEASFRVVGEVARQLGCPIETAARGILDIMAANSVRAIRAISVERGHDPRDFALMPFGGAGPLHAEAVARALGIRTILVPLLPGILCAEGLLVAGRSEALVRSQRLLLDAAAPARWPRCRQSCAPRPRPGSMPRTSRRRTAASALWPTCAMPRRITNCRSRWGRLSAIWTR